ncbi:hypothetical protein ONA91_33600 [Micromonospora sp. DR5-3]|uniref:hypothetical protein n=1 Tax=unclassified Micromonospora TaxID=2617518 RepID=UPI0011DA99A6|nr:MULTISPECIES: hypothetical protein [unclassified Micromonospora]MCW3819390.1 hypothetical protein [Micromonospora sp. DR5-3]TYC20817.1 hypothetical protein FXF52_29410 [Micromonospora sp. MP36]
MRRIRAGLVLGLLLVLGMAGCGTPDSSEGVATADGSGDSASSAKADQLSDQERGLRFAQCMREHGIDIPDPQDGGGVQIRLPEGTDPQQAQAATQQCKEYLPDGGEPQKADPQTVEQQRAYAQCMRNNGVPKFPDPDANGGIKIDSNSGFDPGDPKVKAAQQTCARYQPAAPSGGPSGAPQTWSNR